MKFSVQRKRFLTASVGIFALVLSLSLAGCELQTAADDESIAPASLELTMTTDGIMESVTGGAGSTVANSTSVPVEANVSVAFDADIDATTLTSTTFKVTRVDTSEVLAGTISYANRVATFIPSRVFVYDTTNKTKIRKGLKQDTSYTVTLAAASIKSTSGAAQGTANYSFTFKTVNLDYGFFFLGANGEYQKAVAGVSNPYFDKSKPTIVYYHGWQNGSTKNEDFGNDNAFFWNSATVPAYNTIGSWKNKGYNVCIAYWAQFADEGEVKDAEGKLWTGLSAQKMRYMNRAGSYVTTFSTAKSVTDLLFDQYVAIFNGSAAGTRFMGHSLGNQLATLMAYKISTAVAAGTVSNNLMPVRVALLDPFWGKSSQTYCGNMLPAAKCVLLMKEMLARNAFALEEIRTNSNIGYWVGDSCNDMRKMSFYVCPWPSFGDDTAKHCYSYNWYSMSVNASLNAGTAYPLGANATDAQVKAASNWDYTTKAMKSTVYKCEINAGKSTPAVTDDTFTRSTGI